MTHIFERTTRFVWTAVFCLCASTGAHANLLTNGGFETGDLTGWTLTNSAGIPFTTWVTTTGVVPPLTPHNGAYFLSTGENGRTSTLSQTFATTPNQEYRFSFWLEVGSAGATPLNAFIASFGGTTLLNLSNSPDFGYRQFVYQAIATSATTTIAFTARNDPYGWGLDDVSVTPYVVPEPTVVSLMAFGLAGLGFRRKAV